MRDAAGQEVPALSGARGSVVILSENPMHDSGGGQRSAHVARELLARDRAVLFVSRGTVRETVDLGLHERHPRLVQRSLRACLGGDGPALLRSFLTAPGAFVLTQAPVAEWLPVLETARSVGATTVYDCMDPWDSEMGRGWYRPENERSIARASDVLVASAPALVDRVEGAAERRTHLLPNALDAGVFRRDVKPERPAAMPADGRVALFIGALWGSWYDWGLVRAAADACPETTFVFVGDHRREGRRLPDNCVFTGLAPNRELPAYQAHADVAFLPWVPTPATHAMSPVTVYEHLGTGLPVVATDVETVRGMPGVRVAADEAAFVDAIREHGRATLGEAERAEVAAFAERNSWSVRTDRLLELVDESRRGRSRGAPAVHTKGSISVVIPSYNHERFIGEAIDSVAAQTLPASELVVVDDGSTDGSLGVIERHAFEGTRVIPQPNRGAHAAINRAVTLSRGDWIAILNSDDVFEPERLEHAWATARAKGAGLVIGAVSLIDGDGAPLAEGHETESWYRGALRVAREASSLADAVREENVAVTTSSFFFHKELWRRVGGFRPYRYVHDYDFLLRAVELCPDRVVHAEELRDVRYRVHGDNTISEDVTRALDERASMMRTIARPAGRVRRALVRRSEARDVARAVEAGSAYEAGPATGAAPSDGPRVGLVATTLDAGGLEEIISLLALGLRARGVATSVLCTHRGGAVAARLADSGMSVTVGDGTPASWTRWFEAARPDVLSTHFVDRDAIETLADGGTPVVETVHNTYAWLDDPGWDREREKARWLAGTIAVSSTVARYYAERCPDAPTPAVVPNAVDPGRAARIPRSLARRWLGVPDGATVFVHHGRLAEQKNLPGLADAFAEALASLPDARLILAGSAGDGAVLKRLRDEHGTLFHRGIVRRLPFLDAIGTLLSAADAFASASFYEGWSVAASEALWVGVPVVLTECGGAAELVGTGGVRGRLVPNPVGDPLSVTRDTMARPPAESAEESVRALAHAMLDVGLRADEWARRRDVLRSYARSMLSPGRLASDYARILGSVVAR